MVCPVLDEMKEGKRTWRQGLPLCWCHHNLSGSEPLLPGRRRGCFAGVGWVIGGERDRSKRSCPAAQRRDSELKRRLRPYAKTRQCFMHTKEERKIGQIAAFNALEVIVISHRFGGILIVLTEGVDGTTHRILPYRQDTQLKRVPHHHRICH